MKTLTRYILASFLTALALTVLVFTFVMSIGAIFGGVDWLTKGVPLHFLLRLFATSLPEVLSFSIPVGILTSVLLTFGRLSSDGEITATKACGVSIWQITTPVLLISVCFTLVCLLVNNEIAPRAVWSRRQLKREVDIEIAVKLLRRGRTMDLPGAIMYVGSKEGSELKQILIWQEEDGGNEMKIQAESGLLEIAPDKKAASVTLFNVRITNSQKQPRDAYFKRYPQTINLDEMVWHEPMKPRPPDMALAALVEEIGRLQIARLSAPDAATAGKLTALYVQVNKRIVLALSCFTFALIGMPLGIRAHRKESTIGVGMSILLAFLFYLFLIVADSLATRPEWHPELIVWIPVGLSLGLGLCLLQRAN
ncbi:MAG: LptF/LptG family permease [Kiritimatiellae bacterium]|nr:LptF/LptG family permease [Kiritimatiellia bacterium]